MLVHITSVFYCRKFVYLQMECKKKQWHSTLEKKKQHHWSEHVVEEFNETHNETARESFFANLPEGRCRFLKKKGAITSLGNTVAKAPEIGAFASRGGPLCSIYCTACSTNSRHWYPSERNVLDQVGWEAPPGLPTLPTRDSGQDEEVRFVLGLSPVELSVLDGPRHFFWWPSIPP